MFKLYSNLLPFLYPPDASNTGGSVTTVPTETTKEDMIEFMGEDDDKEVIPLPDDKDKDKETPKDEEKDKETSEEDDELKEFEEELAEPTEEQLELVTPVRRKEILAKYPTLFKDFPYLEKAYYREQQFTELLPTIEDAKAAVEAKNILNSYEQEVMSGNTETILKTVKSESPEAFNKLVDNYLVTLRNVDEGAYFHILGNTVKATIIGMIQEARNTENEDLGRAAHLLNQFVFGTSNFVPPTSLSKTEVPQDKRREDEISQREQAYNRQRFEDARTDLNTRVNNALRSTIEANIDPKQSMTDYVRRNASRDAMEQLESLLEKDARFKVLNDKLWETAIKEGFTRESQDRIRSAFVSRAKSLLPSVIKKARIEALRGIGRRVGEETEERPDKKGPIAGGRPRSQSTSGKITKASDIPKGMRTLDFLMQD